MGVGRYFCVALPFLLTVASIVCLLIGGLQGVVSNSSLFLFEVNTKNLSIDPLTLENLITKIESRADWHDSNLLNLTGSGSGSNLTASDLSLADVYDVNMWGYCATYSNGTKSCTKAKFDWAETYLNTSNVQVKGQTENVTFPDTIKNSLTAFKAVSKWTQIVYIIAMVALGVELVFGLFTACSRVVSCLTWVVSGIASAAVLAACAMMTAMAVIVVGAVEGTAKWYGVTGSFNGGFLAVIWLGAAFALAAGFFWLFSICCCKPEHRHHSYGKRHADEKFAPPGSYQPLSDPAMNRGYSQQYGVPRHQSSGPRSDLAYEPFSHSHSNV